MAVVRDHHLARTADLGCELESGNRGDRADRQTSFQLSLLGGSNTQTEIDLYIICSIFVVATVAWYTLFRMKPSVYVLSLPWLM